MLASALSPYDLFDGTVHYEVPPFQRPYVWTEEDQWQPLWDDIARVAEKVLADTDVETRHFLGAVVLKALRQQQTSHPLRWSVIDGQQRLTTLQLLLDAAEVIASELGATEPSEVLQELVWNGAARFSGTPFRFKLWPARSDRESFAAVMDNSITVAGEIADTRIAQAHAFFCATIRDWAAAGGDARQRLAVLADVLQQRLQIVAINLDTSDDDQVIFETLNDRGTPLLAADLIKNYLFQRCADLGADVDDWGDKYWSDFDGDWWRDQVAQGRLFRSRIDLFLQYWLTMRTKEEVPTDAVFARFRSHADARTQTAGEAEQFLRRLRTDADTFRDFAAFDPGTARGAFYGRVVEALELGVFIPLLLWLISDDHETPDEQRDKALNAVESWAVRRTLLRFTMKDVNHVVVAMLSELDGHAGAGVGDAMVAFLASQTADARLWPTDGAVLEGLPEVYAYNIKQQRLRAVLGAIELHIRGPRTEPIPLPTKLEIEHVMPQGWREHWDDGTASDADAAAARDRRINTIGNLTLVTQRLNGALSHRPWTDAEAQAVAPTGRDAGLGKRSLLARFSILTLNNEIVTEHEHAWTDHDIVERSKTLAHRIVSIWPGPPDPSDFDAAYQSSGTVTEAGGEGAGRE